MRVYETVLYADDLASATRFYGGVLGLRLVDGPDELAVAFRLGDRAMLLVFDPARAGAPGRRVPSHGTSGPGHVAFGVEPGSLEVWRARLAEAGVELEQDIEWSGGRGRSLYVRDPAGNSVELVDGDLWPP